MIKKILKFGGTSVGTIERIQHVANIIQKEHSIGNQVIAVVSAMSGKTNDLITLSKEISTEFNKRELDVLLSSGEQITSALLSGALIKLDVKAKSWLNWQIPIITDGEHANARIINMSIEKINKMNCKKVLIHDSARPMPSKKLVSKIINALKKNDAVIPVTKIYDATKRVKNNLIFKNIERKTLRCSQTPQGFTFEKIYKKHNKYKNKSFDDDSALFVNDNEKDWNDFESILKALEKFIKTGKIRYIGMSNETPFGLSKYIELSKNKNLPRMMSVQNPYNLVNRTYEIGMSEISLREKCGLLVYYPLAAGGLSGKYRNGQMPKNSRMDLFFQGWGRHLNPLAMKAYDEYYKLAKDNNMTMVQLAQSFVNSRPFVTSNIIGATTMGQLKENIDSINIELNDEVLKKINLIHNNNPNPSP